MHRVSRTPVCSFGEKLQFPLSDGGPAVSACWGHDLPDAGICRNLERELALSARCGQLRSQSGSPVGGQSWWNLSECDKMPA
jgi:hypothetical protein